MMHEHNAMKTPLDSSDTPFLDINYNPMRSPNASSTIPHLLDIDPLAQFEFHYPYEDMWWDLSDFSSSETEEEYPSDSDLNVSFTSSFYQFIHDPDYIYEEDEVNNEDDMKDDAKEEIDICRRSPREEDEVENEEDLKNWSRW